ncbi:restriction endonuclease subunit S [Marinomonas gallaica]|uniref:restriction endonuclease subunit S n=1 Tax=Marinomonas gallaica TaxID=1806667 RepID=UPI003A8F7177
MIQQCKLSDLAEIRSGYTFREKVEEVDEGDVYLIQPKDFRFTKEIKGQDYLEISDLPMIFWEGRSTAFIQDECVLMPARGEYREALYISASELARNTPVVAGSQFFIIYPKREVSAQYLCWVIGQPQCQNYLSQTGEGSALRTLKISSLNEMPIPVPSEKVRSQILELHRCWLEERKLTRKLLENREKMVKGIYQNLLK